MLSWLSCLKIPDSFRDAVILGVCNFVIVGVCFSMQSFLCGLGFSLFVKLMTKMIM